MSWPSVWRWLTPPSPVPPPVTMPLVTVPLMRARTGGERSE